MNTAWSHLPNATAIDRIIADVKTNDTAWSRARSQAWDAAWDAARSALGDAVGDAAWSRARSQAWDAARSAARSQARSAAWYAAVEAAWLAARTAAWDTIIALIAWDDCGYLLDTDPEQVQVLAQQGQPAAVLLLPAVIALNQKTSKELTHG